MCKTKTGILQFDADIGKTERVPRRAARLTRVRTEQQETIIIQDYSLDESEITLGDYGRLNSLNEVSLGFQKVNPVLFDIKNSVMMNLKSNPFSG